MKTILNIKNQSAEIDRDTNNKDDHELQNF